MSQHILATDSPILRRWSPALLTITWACGLWLTWGTWADPQIDFGRELYVPWRMSEGDVLYRDIAYFNGPLSPAWNALVCCVSPSLWALSVVNAVLLLVAVLLVSRWLEQLFGVGAGLAAGLTFLWLFAFNQYLPVGNYNWICPYSHEMTHAVILAGVALWLLCRFIATGARPCMWASGLVTGLVLLTKCEIAIALLGATAAGCVAVCWRDWSPQEQRRQTLRSVLPGLLLIPVPTMTTMVLLRYWLPWPVAIESALGSWMHLLQPELRNSPFYRAVMGTSDLTNSFTLMYGWSILYVAVFAVILAAARRGQLGGRPRAVSVGLATGIVIGGVLLSSRIELESAARPWPVVLCLLTGGTLLQLRDWKRRKLSDGEFARLAAILVLQCFSGLMLLKILFFARVTHYGFALGLPSTLLIVATVWAEWPAWVGRRGGSPMVARAGLAALGLVLTAGYLQVSAHYLASKQLTLGTGLNRMAVDDRGRTLGALLSEIEHRVPPGSTLCCVPEGALINVLSQRPTSLKYINFVPADLLIFGEAAVLVEMQTNPPDFIASIDRDTSEYGLAHFGQDYALEIGAWIEAQYVEVWTAADADAAGSFGARLLRRRTSISRGRGE